jgi:hypothetical protein
VQELLRFPAGTHDDQVDTLSLIGRMLDQMVPGSKPALMPEPLNGATVVTGMQMPIDCHWQHTTRDAILRLDNRLQRI